MLQSELHELSDETSNPNSLIHRCSKSQRDELKVLLKSCKSDLRDLDKTLPKYNSLKTADPQTRDRVLFSADKQREIRLRISTHSDRLNLFLTHLNSGTLGRIEATQEIHTNAFGEIKAHLRSIHEEVRAGKKDPTLLTSMEDSGTLESELVDDNITVVDEESDKDKIREWLQRIREEDTEVDQNQNGTKPTDGDHATAEDDEEDVESGSRIGIGDDIKNDASSSVASDTSIQGSVVRDSPRVSTEHTCNLTYQQLRQHIKPTPSSGYFRNDHLPMLVPVEGSLQDFNDSAASAA